MKNPPIIIDLEDGHRIEISEPTAEHVTSIEILPSILPKKKPGTHTAKLQLDRHELHALFTAIKSQFAAMDERPLDPNSLIA